ncbi:hypothetical protein [Shewanella surugensis]|uniref:Phosphate ABC transporter substrate-binding protein n=1 Tax=Shewanella surugensis TaxID=212020 RepID=A0ABT0LIN3_9GAMM|nr:hypothetical protein [Shewanella surugensis]MCL1127449.1 hypothetical protein [Shewanella surugensis]
MNKKKPSMLTSPPQTLLLLWFTFISTFAYAEDTKFAVFSMNPDLPKISNSKVRMIYKGKTDKLNNKKIELADWENNSRYKEEFYKILLGKTVSQVNGYWASLAFSGKASLPHIIDGDNVDELVSWLKENTHGIGYAPSPLVPEDANILITIEKGQ